jgi:hypothetical protein
MLNIRKKLVDRFNRRIFFLALLLGAAACIIVYNPFSPSGSSDVKLPPPDRVGEVYDLVVVGGDPEGIAAAVSGARNGLSVLLVDNRPVLGGLMTRGWLNSIDMNYGPDGDILNKGIFLEFYRQIKGDSFDVTNAVRVFNKLVTGEENLTVLLNVAQITPLVEDSAGGPVVRGVRLAAGREERQIRAARVIDATQDADLAALAGVPYSTGQEDIGRQAGRMAATLVFKLKGIGPVDWLKIRYYLTYRDNKKSTGANRLSAWGFSEITSKYTPSTGRLMLRGLNMGRQNDGSVLVNALLIFGVDPLDPASRRAAREVAVQELPRVVEFLNKNVPGLGDAELAGAAPELYVRESRHIYGEYRLTIDDVLENRDFPDSVAFGSYPVDIQPSGPGIPGVIIGRPEQYAIPFRCLVPQKVDGLLVVGRAAGFDSLAHGSARTIPVGMAAGQAAGVAAALALENDMRFRELAADPTLIKELQRRLNEQGMELKPFHIENKLAGHPAYAGLKFVRSLGLAAGGYNNDYKLDQPIDDRRFINVLARAVRQSGIRVEEHPLLYTESNAFTLYDACYMLARYLGLETGKKEAFEYLKARGLFERDAGYWQTRLDPEKPLTHGAAYMLVKDFIQRCRLYRGAGC